MSDLLFEIGTEELPPGLINNLTNQIKENIKNELKINNILTNDNEIKTFSTPRRIAIYIGGLTKEQPTRTVEAKGPEKSKAFDINGNPTQAGTGFAKKYNLEPKDLLTKKINDIEYVYAITSVGGEKTINILSNILPKAISETTGEKFMSWGNYNEKFARPIRWILAILDNEVIKFGFSGLTSDKYSYGHRFLSNKKIEINSPKEYEGLLEKNRVIACPKKRKEKIIKLIEKEAENIGALYIEDYDKRLDEITNITEYPCVIVSSFDKEFLILPSTVIVTVLVKHQKYFPTLSRLENEGLLSKFIVITNGTETINNSIEEVKRGNEKVVKARLNDAKFFYDEDLKRPFTYDERINDLSKITFQKGLGSIEEKVLRLLKLSEYLYSCLSNPDFKKEDLITSVKLCKLDLTTHIIFEMPELQGTIGAIYARENKYSELICKGISEHYEQCPKSQISSLIGIADKLDNIICLFALGKIPSGSSDPFALRRQAQGIIDSILNNLFNVNITSTIDYFTNKISDENIKNKITNNTILQIKSFLIDRFITSMGIAFGYEKDLINSVCSVGDPLANINDTKDKIKCINEYYSNKKEKFIPFLISAKRLVRIVEANINGNIDLNVLTTEYENQLLKRFNEIEKKQHKSYNDFLHELFTLTDTINTFFDKVLVNDPDPKVKQTRQALLKKGKDLFERICDFNQIVERN